MSKAFNGYWMQGTGKDSEVNFQNMPYNIVKKLSKKEELRLQIKLNSKDYLKFLESTETEAIRKDFLATAILMVAFVALFALIQTALTELYTM